MPRLPAAILLGCCACCAAFFLSFLAGCGTSAGGLDGGEPRGKVEDGHIELPPPRPVPGLASDEWSPPPVWLVSGRRIVQGSYGEFCKLDDCTGMETPEQMGEDLASMRIPKRETYLVVGGGRVSGLAAGTREWGSESDGPPVPGVYTEPGVPPGMRNISLRRIPDGGEPAAETAPSAETTGRMQGGAVVFDLSSTGEPGDRRLSVFLEMGEYDRAVYHWRLDPGRPGSTSPEASPETTTNPIEELTAPQETTAEDTTSLAGTDERDVPAFRGVAMRSVGVSPTGIAAGEGHVWALDRDSGPGTALLKLDPDTGRTLSAMKVPDTSSGLEAGAGAVWLIEEEMGTVLRLDPATGKIVRRIRVGGSPSEVAVDRGSAWVAVADGDRRGRIVRIGSRAREAGGTVAEIEVPGAVEGIAVDDASGDVWASVPGGIGDTGGEEGRIFRVDPATNSITGRLAVPGGVSGIAAGGGALWATTPDGEMLEILVEERRISNATPLPPPGPYEMEFGAGAIWVAGVDTLTRVEPGSGGSRTLKTGAYGAEDLAVGGGYVWAIGPGDGPGGRLTRVKP